jgi:hypothetical protein
MDHTAAPIGQPVEIAETYRFNNDQTVETEVGTFYVEQRNAGFEPNDGAWIVTQLPELYWTTYGTLRRRRPVKRLGVFADIADAVEAIEAAEPQPVDDVALN